MVVAINLCGKIGVLRRKFTPNLFDFCSKNGVLRQNFTPNLFDLRGVLANLFDKNFTPNLFDMVNLWRSHLK